jgi:hypothetical protein
MSSQSLLSSNKSYLKHMRPFALCRMAAGSILEWVALAGV